MFAAATYVNSSTQTIAAIVDWGTLDPPEIGFFGQLHTNPNHPSGSQSFSDDYTFNVSSQSSFGSAVLNFNLLPKFNIDDLTVSLFEVGMASPLASTAGDGSFLEILTLYVSGVVPSRDYLLNIAGVVPESKEFGKYVGKFAVVTHQTTAVVPIPPTIILLVPALLGLLLVGRMRRGLQSSQV